MMIGRTIPLEEGLGQFGCIVAASPVLCCCCVFPLAKLSYIVHIITHSLGIICKWKFGGGMIRDMMWWTFVGDIYVDLCGE
jgi:hypothetical protein